MKIKMYIGKIKQRDNQDYKENPVAEYILDHKRAFRSNNLRVQIDARSDMARELCYDSNPEDF